MIRTIIIIVLWPTLMAILYGQEISILRRYSLKDGLPSLTIYDIKQDSKGYLWVATEEGLCRFDGRTFVSIEDAAWHSKAILQIMVDSKDRIWSSLDNEHPEYYADGTVHRIESISRKISRKYNSYHERQDNKIGITHRRSLYVVDEDNNVIESSSINQLQYDIISSTKNALYDDQTILLGYKKQPLTIFNHSDSTVTSIDSKSHKKLEQLSIHSCYQEFDNVWICTSDGLYHGTISKKFHDLTRIMDSIIPYRLTSDRDGNFWLGSKNSGLYHVSRSQLLSATHTNPLLFDIKNVDNVFSFDSIICLAVNRRNVFVYNSRFELTHHFLVGKGDIVYNIVKQGENLYTLCNKELMSYNLQTKKIGTKTPRTSAGIFKHLHELPNDELLIIGSEFLHIRKNEEPLVLDYFPNQKILVSGVVSDSMLWYATSDELYSYNFALKTPPEKIKEIRGFAIHAIFKLANDEAIIITSNGRIDKYNSKTNKIIKSQTLRNTLVTDVLIQEKIFLATPNGVIYVNPFSLEIDGFSEFNEYLQHEDVLFVDKFQENLVMGTKSKILKLQHDAVQNHDKLNLHFDAFFINDSFSSFTTKPVLHHSKNNIRISYSCPFFSLERPYFQYVLTAGKSQDTIQTNESSVYFSSLQPGQYTFTISAKTNLGLNSDPVSLQFDIRPPWWRSTWFYILSICFILLVIYYLYRQNEERSQARYSLLQERLSALQAQMNPHFLFNALQSLQYYISKNDRKRASSYLTIFATLVRKTLESSAQEYILLEDEIDYLTSYLEMEKEKLDGNLNYEFLYNQNLKASTMIPTMIIQPFVENSIVHGFGSRSVRNHIQIFFEKTTSKEIRCEITDNGRFNPPNTPKSGHKSFSSKAVEKRIKLLHQLHKTSPSKNKTGIQILSNADARSVFEEGTTVRLTLPCIQASP